VRVVMHNEISGLRNGEPWPLRGESIDLPEDEALALLASGAATAPEDETVTVQPEPGTPHNPISPMVAATPVGDAGPVPTPLADSGVVQPAKELPADASQGEQDKAAEVTPVKRVKNAPRRTKDNVNPEPDHTPEPGDPSDPETPQTESPVVAPTALDGTPQDAGDSDGNAGTPVDPDGVLTKSNTPVTK
jgi:hypothetical protein